MAPEKARRSTRSKSASGLQTRSPSPAAPNDQQGDSRSRPSLSARHNNNKTLPPKVIRRDSTEGGQETETSEVRNNENLNTQPKEGIDSSPNPSQSTFHNHLSEKDSSAAPVGSDLGDNRGKEHGSEGAVKLSQEHIAETLTQVLAELKDIKGHISKIDKLEEATVSLTKEISGVVNRTIEIETAVSSNAARLREVDDELITLKATVQKQKETISNTEKWKEEAAQETNKAVAHMNDLVGRQQKQVDTFNSNTQKLQQHILSEVDRKVSVVKKELKEEYQIEMNTFKKEIKKENKNEMNEFKNELKKENKNEMSTLKNELKKDMNCQKLKNQAYNNRQNLVVIGLQPDSKKSDLELTVELCQSLGVAEAGIATVYRLGRQHEQNSGYVRPLMVKFTDVEQRNLVWRKRMGITSENDSHKIRIQADLPKPLREGLQVMQRVVKAASKIPEFESAKINDYSLQVNDKSYQVTDLENLPRQLRPSTLSMPQSDAAMVFFTKHAFMSNHHLSDFKIEGDTYHSVEQYLAVCRAKLAGNQPLINRAKASQDPIQAKHILNALREDHPEVWDEKVKDTIMEALRAKFSQNRSLRDKLCNTGQLTLGEASKNPRWGIGMDLSDEEVLNTEKWLKDGNLLGKSLMEIRDELQKGRPAGKNKPKKDNRKGSN